MPTVLLVNGWRFFFYANEGHEPIHIHAKKGDKRAKFWIDPVSKQAIEAYSRRMNGTDKRQVCKIIIDNLETLVSAWLQFEKQRNR